LKHSAMKRIFLIAFAFTAISLLPSPVMAQQDHSTYYYQQKSLFERLLNTRGEILLIGDSITDGGEWSELFKNRKVKNRGISGDVTKGVLDRLEEITEGRPRKVFLMIGVNDLARGIPAEKITENILLIVERIRQASPKTKIYVQSILPVNDEFSKFANHVNKGEEIKSINQRLREQAGKQYQYIDLYSGFVTKEGKLNPEYTNDGLHLTGAGYLEWKKLIHKYIK